MAASARAAPRTLRDQFFNRKPQAHHALGPPANGNKPRKKSKTIDAFKLKPTVEGIKGAEVVSVVQPSKLGKAYLDPSGFEPVKIVVREQRVVRSAGGNSGGDVPEWQPRWSERFGEGWGPYSALVNLLLNAELMTPPGSLRKHGGYVSTGWDGSPQCPPQPDSLVCHVNNIHELEVVRRKCKLATAHSQAQKANHVKDKPLLVEDEPLSIESFSGIDAANKEYYSGDAPPWDEGTVVPDSASVSNVGTGRNIHGKDAKEKEVMDVARMWEDTHMHVVTQMQMENEARLSSSCVAVDCDMDGVEVQFKYESGHTAVRRTPSVKFWETLDDMGWRVEDFDTQNKLFSNESMRQLFGFPRPEDVESPAHVGAFAYVKRRNEELRQMRAKAEEAKRDAMAKAKAAREKPVNELVQVDADRMEAIYKATALSAKKAEQRNARIYGEQPGATDSEVYAWEWEYVIGVRDVHRRYLQSQATGLKLPEVRAGQSDCKVEQEKAMFVRRVQSDDKRYQMYWLRLLTTDDEAMLDYRLACKDVTSYGVEDQSIGLNRVARKKLWLTRTPVPGPGLKTIARIAFTDWKYWRNRKAIAEWKKEQLKERMFAARVNAALDGDQPFDTGYPPKDGKMAALSNAMALRVKFEGTSHDEEGELEFLAKGTGLQLIRSHNPPPDFADLVGRAIDSIVINTVESKGGVLIPEYTIKPETIKFVDNMGTPLLE